MGSTIYGVLRVSSGGWREHSLPQGQQRREGAARGRLRALPHGLRAAGGEEVYGAASFHARS